MYTDVKQIDLTCIMVASTNESTLSRLWIKHLDSFGTDGNEGAVLGTRGLCWVLEDGYNAIKVPKKTRIPAGRYRVRPTRSSKFYPIYRADPNLRLQYVLTLEAVPNYDLIRVHAGEDVGDTDGCPLPGLATGMDGDSNFTVMRSREALKRIHKQLDPYFLENKMDFSIPIFWEAVRTPLIELYNHYSNP